MKIQAGYRITFNCLHPMPINLKLSVHPDRRHDLITPDTVQLSVDAPLTQHIDDEGRRSAREHRRGVEQQRR